MRLARVALTLLLAAASPGIATAQSLADTGAIAGFVTDISGGRLPGVTVEADADTLHRTVVTDADGRYELRALPPGLYSVSARLQGFQIVRDQRRVTTGGAVDFNAVLQIGCRGEEITLTLADVWMAADTFVRVRITGGTSDDSFGAALRPVRRRATVLTAFKPGFLALTEGSSFEFVQFGIGTDAETYDAGQELVLPLHWSTAWNSYFRLHMRCTPMGIGIHADQISVHGILGYKGKTVEELIRDLRALTAR